MTNIPANQQGLISHAAQQTGLPESLVAAQVNMESGFNPHAVSPAGAQGEFQFMPGTFRSQGTGGSPFNPNDEVHAYVKLMSSLLHQYRGNVRNALAAYNAGPGNLGAGLGYADKILSAAGHGSGLNVQGRRATMAALGVTQGPGTPGRTQKFTTGGGIDWAGAATAALEREAAKPINPSGTFTAGNPLASMAAAASSGRYQLPTRTTTVKTPAIPGADQLGPGGQARPGQPFNPRPGHVIFAPLARVGLQPGLIDVLSQASNGVGQPLYVGTGKVGHSTTTVNGNVSEHSVGRAADLIAAHSGMTNEQLGQALYRYFTGGKSAPAGGLFNLSFHGHRIQLIYQTMEGGNHYTHVHVGWK